LEKPKATNEIKQALDAIPRLRALSYRNTQIDSWVNSTTQLLEKTYGNNSAESQRFTNACGTAFKVWTEYGQEQDYQRRLDCYEDVLKSLAG
jgi:hypothetical protein